MASLQALHDRFGRNVAFGLRVRLSDNDNPLSRVIGVIGSADARVGAIDLLELG